MRALTVAQVVAAEAGGKTRAQRLQAMKDVYSAAYNRAKLTGKPVKDIVSVKSQFNAYNTKMPAGTASLVNLAEQAIAEVDATGPTHAGTFYARSYATKNLPKGLKQVKKAVDDHIYYSDPKNRAIITATGAAKPRAIAETQIAAAPQAAPAAPMGGLASFFADPLGMSAQAAEAPQGLAAYAEPEAKGLMGATGYDPAKNPMNARVDAMFAANQAQPAAPPSNVSAQDIARQAVNAPVDTMGGLGSMAAQTALGMTQQAAPAASRFAPSASPQVSVAPPASPEHYASVLSPDEQATNARNLGAQVGAMVGPAPAADQGRMSPDGQVADPFGNYVDKGPLGTVQKAETERAPGAALAYGEEPTAPQGLGATAQPAGLPSAPQGLAAAAPTQFGGLLGRGISNMGLYAANNPEIADIAGVSIPDPNESYPEAPTPETTFPAAPDEPTESMFGPKSKRALAGLLMGGPIGGLLGLASGAFSGGLGGPAGMASAGERYNAGTGLQGMQQGINGPRGATGYSRSNPGTFSTSRGPGLGSDLTNQYGAVTPYSASGNIMGNSQSLGAWGHVLGGLFDRPDKDKDKGKSKSGGLGGINGSGYSGKGLY